MSTKSVVHTKTATNAANQRKPAGRPVPLSGFEEQAMTDALPPSTTHSLIRTTLNKVPEITLWFWIIKVLATTVGETGADYLNFTLGFGLGNTSLVMSALLAISLAAQMRARRCMQPLYWLVVVLVSVVGTLLTDNLVDHLGVPLQVLTPLFTVALVATFAAWYAREKTLSMHHIDTASREGWYDQARSILLARDPAHLRARHGGRGPGGGNASTRLPQLLRDVRSRHWLNRPGSLRLQARRRNRVLDCVRAHPPTWGFLGRLVVATRNQWRTGPGNGNNELCLSRCHPELGHLVDANTQQHAGTKPRLGIPSRKHGCWPPVLKAVNPIHIHARQWESQGATASLLGTMVTVFA